MSALRKLAAFDVGILVVAGAAGFSFSRWQSPRSSAASPTKSEILPATLNEPLPRPVPEIRPLRAEVAKYPAVERLSMVIDSRDLPGTARHLLDALAELTAADFRALLDGTTPMPSMMAHGIDKSFGAVFARSFVEHWLAVDEKTALDSFPDLAKKAQRGEIHQYEPILHALITERPREALQAFLAMEPDDTRGPVSQGLKEVFTRLASEKPASARALLDGCRDARQREAAELGIALGLAENDPSSAAAIAVQMKSSEVFQAALDTAKKIGAGAVFEVVSKDNARLLSAYTLNELPLRFPGAPWESIPPDAAKANTGFPLTVLEAATFLSPDMRARLLERSADFPAFMKKDTQAALLMAWADDAPREAADWTLQNAASKESGHILSLVFSKWEARDHDAAIAWLQSLPDTAIRDRLTPQIRGAPKPLEEKPDLAIATARALDAGKSFTFLLGEWFSSDAEAAAEWARGLTDAAQRDRAFRAYATAAAGSDVAAAREWIDAISDPRLRADATRDLVLGAGRQDKAAMHKWVSGLREIAPLRKQWLLRMSE